MIDRLSWMSVPGTPLDFSSVAALSFPNFIWLHQEDAPFGPASRQNLGMDLGVGSPFTINLVVTTAFVGSGAGSRLKFEIRSGQSQVIATAGIVDWISQEYGEAELVAGFALSLPLPYSVGPAINVRLNTAEAGDASDFDSGEIIGWYGPPVSPVIGTRAGQKVHDGSQNQGTMPVATGLDDPFFGTP